MIKRLVGIVTLLWSLTLSLLGVAFGAEDEKQAFLGVVPGEVTSEVATEYGVRAGEGVIVEDVSSGSPAEKMGLRENDIIISVNGAGVTGPEEFRSKIAKMSPGDKVDLTYVRGGKQKTTSAELATREDREFRMMGPGMMGTPRPERAPMPPRAPRERKEIRMHKTEKVAFAGIVAQNLSEGLAKYFKVDEGALISEVVEDSPAEKAGLKSGDVIIKIGNEDIESEGDVREAIQDRKPGDQVEFVIVRDGQQQTVSVTLGEQEMPDLGDLRDFEIQLNDLGDLKDFQISLPDEELEELHDKLRDMKIEIEHLEPMDIHIEQLPDFPHIQIEKRFIGRSVHNGGRDWHQSIANVRDQFRTGFSELMADFAYLRDQIMQIGQDLLGRTA